MSSLSEVDGLLLEAERAGIPESPFTVTPTDTANPVFDDYLDEATSLLAGTGPGPSTEYEEREGVGLWIFDSNDECADIDTLIDLAENTSAIILTPRTQTALKSIGDAPEPEPVIESVVVEKEVVAKEVKENAFEKAQLPPQEAFVLEDDSSIYEGDIRGMYLMGN